MKQGVRIKPNVHDWVSKHIETRVYRGQEWRKELSEHARLASDSRYIRILGDGFRPVSISYDNPCGHLKDKNGGKIEKCNVLSDALKKAKNASGDEYKPGKDKPEHRIQADLIRDALRNGLRINQEFHEFDELIFVTDELSLEAGKDKLRADMIAVGVKNGAYFPVFIELKNARQLSTLKRQLNNAVRMLWENGEARGVFAKFLNAVAGVSVDTSAEAKRMIIWPKSPSGKESKSVKDARQEGFLIAEFEPGYLLQAL